ncbi:hypothetical protein Gotur_034942 [Gossypium turneri]
MILEISRMIEMKNPCNY